MNQHLERGTKISTPYGPATITGKPNAAGVAKIRYTTGDRATLDTESELFQVTEPAAKS